MSDDLKWNKIFGAGLATVLVILGVREVSSRLYESKAESEKMGYAVTVAEEPGEGGAAAEAGPPDWGTVLASADLTAGEAAFAKCKSCHDNASGGPNKTGPNLWGVVGRPTASHPGFAYSDGMKAHAKEAPAWTYDQLYGFIGKPQKWVAGTKMSFLGIKGDKDRINLIAYLRSQGSTGYPIPAPDPSRQPGAAAPAATGAPAAGAAPAAAGAAATAGTTTPAPGAASGQAPASTAPTAQKSPTPATQPAGTVPAAKK